MIKSLLFLDIDGVLNCFGPDGHPPHPFKDKFEADKIELLNEIIKATNCFVVLSSAWRKCNSFLRMRAIFSRVGLLQPRKRYIDHVPCMCDFRPRMHGRGHQIEEYLKQNDQWIEQPPNIVILDDRDDMEPFMGRLVHTKSTQGLTKAHVTKAIKLLGKT